MVAGVALYVRANSAASLRKRRTPYGNMGARCRSRRILQGVEPRIEVDIALLEPVEIDVKGSARVNTPEPPLATGPEVAIP